VGALIGQYVIYYLLMGEHWRKLACAQSTTSLQHLPNYDLAQLDKQNVSKTIEIIFCQQPVEKEKIEVTISLIT